MYIAKICACSFNDKGSANSIKNFITITIFNCMNIFK